MGPGKFTINLISNRKREAIFLFGGVLHSVFETNNNQNYELNCGEQIMRSL
jgi:hypothetical protein